MMQCSIQSWKSLNKHGTFFDKQRYEQGDAKGVEADLLLY